MKFAPLLLVPFLVAPVQAYEGIGDRSNQRAYQDAQSTNWFTRTYSPPEGQFRDRYEGRRWRANNDYQRGYSNETTCFRDEYREEYVPGTRNDPGYVRTYSEQVEVPCRGRRPTVIRERTPSPDGNECSEGAILGGILGGGAGAALSQGDGRWWAIPLGVVTGSVIGCDIDGG